MKNERDKLSASRRFKALFFGAVMLVSLVLVLYGAYVQEGMRAEVGEVSIQRITAPRKIENTVATERNRQAALEAAEDVKPVVERDASVTDDVRLALNGFFEKVTIVRQSLAISAMEAEAEAQRQAEEQRLREQADLTPGEPEGGAVLAASSPDAELDDIFTRQTEAAPEQTPEASSSASAEPPEPSASTTAENILPIYLNDHMVALILDMEEAAYLNFQKETHAAAETILADGLQDVDAKGLMSVKDAVETLGITTDEKSLCYEILAAYIKPNIVENTEATAALKAERAAQYETVYYLKDQMIVDQNEVISAEALAALSALGLIKNESGTNWALVSGAALLIFAVFALFFLYMRFFQPNQLRSRKEVVLLAVLVVAAILVTFATIPFPYQFSGHIVFMMLIAMLFDAGMAVVINVFLSIVCMLIAKGDLEFLSYYIFTGTFVCFAARFTNERNKITLAGSATSLVCFLAYLGVSLFFEKSYTRDILYNALYAGGIGLISVIVSIGSAPFWEGFFGLVTPYRLMDLASPNSPVLRRLTIEAPGTYHHSLIVANLAETAAYEIGANATLARAGGYYHDIGKLKYPQYFSENQLGVNPHDEMDPYSSAQVLSSHVTFGLELAEANRLPQIIQDIIAQHHGSTLMKFFYNKAKCALEAEAAEGAEPAELPEADFRYHNETPQFRESALVMLADTVEAAVRSMIPSGKAMCDVEALVRVLVKDKLDDGQLIDSGLTMRDIEKSVDAFILVFKGMYHDRIPYPDDTQKSVKAI